MNLNLQHTQHTPRDNPQLDVALRADAVLNITNVNANGLRTQQKRDLN